MQIASVITYLESLAPLSLQESYDNAGLITGNKNWDCKGILCALDATEDIIREAVEKKCNLVVAHHPVIFKGLKRLNGTNYVERTIIEAIKNDIAIYAIHTNLDNISNGVSGRIAEKLKLKNTAVLDVKPATLKKLFTFVPEDHAEKLRQAIFDAGGGHIGNYSACSFSSPGTGTFKAGAGSDPFVGTIGEQHQEKETKIEVIFPAYLETVIVRALKVAHPYEEPAFDIVKLENPYQQIGAGIIGELENAMEEKAFLEELKKSFGLTIIRHTPLISRPVKRVAVCGGAGSFLISKALQQNADIYITGDIKYHEFFDADGKMVIADIGHYESEQFTIDLLLEVLEQKFPTFAVLKTAVNTNPVQYY